MRFLPALLLSFCFVRYLPGQEFGFTVGSVTGPIRTAKTGQTLNLSTGVALEANYARPMKSYKYADLYGEVNVVGNPRQSIDSTLTSVTRNTGSLYLTPGVRVKFYPKKTFSPWVVGGGGYALYSQSDKTIAGAANPSSRYTNTGALEMGGGGDFVWSPRLSFRAEARTFFTGSPAYNTPLNGRGQFNFIIGGGIVFHPGLK